ncbi:CST complex subunit Ten1 [Colletotrichum phormii]|uniref:CST complex subunit Ten1 n=1 Tax=Colletotrichum phormii TaxID=359342 RepID=A0AAJ0EM79_9PEZI|nr:CST complex subunit Ten1 [Colletotrichum phormii]KAK1654183.1 CST complex subunit Ten1 [Colletotrichum phormii]
MSRGPLPSQLCLLSDLPSRPQGDKVRFLGCVTAYSTHSAVLTLEHSFPKGSDISVLVNVQLLLSTMTSNQTRIGEWVNVVGYLTPSPAGTRAKGTSREPRRAAVQALMLWSAGPLNLQRYEASFTTD